MTKSRGRTLGLDFPGTPGTDNAITDVAGVAVGYTTVIEGEGALQPGKGPVRTGVTAILPKGHNPEPHPVWAGAYALNGNGEMTGTHWIPDGGYLIGPVCITNTHSVGIVHHAAVRWIIETYRETWGEEHLWAMPVVAETYDGVLNDINGQHLTESHALDAMRSAKPGAVSEGNVGGGTGMICYEFKGGTGTASRRISIDRQDFTVAALVQAAEDADLIITSGGASVGEEDHIRNAITTLGTLELWRVAVKPGKPTVFGTIGATPVLGMPGYPTSCLSNAYMLLVPMLRRMARLPTHRCHTVSVPAAQRFVSTTGRHQFYTVRVVDGLAVPAFKASGDITSMSQADGYIEIPAQTDLVEKGETVVVKLF